MWIYKSPIGEIRIVENKDNTYSVVIDDECYGSYLSAVAADDVYNFATGCDEWDENFNDDNYQLSVPTDIQGWEFLSDSSRKI